MWHFNVNASDIIARKQRSIFDRQLIFSWDQFLYVPESYAGGI